MPSQPLNTRWGASFPTVQDIEGGVNMMHERCCDPFCREVAPTLLTWKSRVGFFFRAETSIFFVKTHYAGLRGGDLGIP